MKRSTRDKTVEKHQDLNREVKRLQNLRTAQVVCGGEAQGMFGILLQDISIDGLEN